MTSVLRLAVVASAVWAVAVLGALHLRARRFGRRELFAPAAGSPRRGVVYAFTAGMLPSAKESVREHLATWFAGVGYHLGIAAGFAHLAMLLARIEPAAGLRGGMQLALLAGTLGGAGLLAKRILTPQLRGLSSPDDYISNLLATAFAALALAHTMIPGLEELLLGETALLFLWVPLGKIRHCLFFFTARYHLATHFGRRGTFPPGP